MSGIELCRLQCLQCLNKAVLIHTHEDCSFWFALKHNNNWTWIYLLCVQASLGYLLPSLTLSKSLLISVISGKTYTALRSNYVYPIVYCIPVTYLHLTTHSLISVWVPVTSTAILLLLPFTQLGMLWYHSWLLKKESARMTFQPCHRFVWITHAVV